MIVYSCFRLKYLLQIINDDNNMTVLVIRDTIILRLRYFSIYHNRVRSIIPVPSHSVKISKSQRTQFKICEPGSFNLLTCLICHKLCADINYRYCTVLYCSISIRYYVKTLLHIYFILLQNGTRPKYR